MTDECGTYVGDQYGPGQWFSDRQIDAGADFLVANSRNTWREKSVAREWLLDLLRAMQVDESAEDRPDDEDELSFLARMFLLGEEGHITTSQYERLEQMAGRTTRFAEASRG